MEKRYQVFISSTFHYLEAARQEVLEALLKVDYFPAGWSFFLRPMRTSLPSSSE